MITLLLSLFKEIFGYHNGLTKEQRFKLQIIRMLLFTIILLSVLYLSVRNPQEVSLWLL